MKVRGWVVRNALMCGLLMNLAIAGAAQGAPVQGVPAQGTRPATAAGSVAETAGQTQDDQEGPKTLEEKACFIIGYNFIRSMQSQKVEFLLDSVIAGMRTAADNKEIGMTDEEVVAVMDSFEQKMMERYQAKLKAEAEENQAAGEKYLETNRTKEGVQALPSGVQFRVLKAGTGNESPKGEDSVEVHYAGRTIDGTEFDSSIKRGEPATFPVLQVIKGFSEALQNMKVGDKWEVTIPAHLAYGMKGQGPIGPNQVLIFEVELLQIKKQ